MRNACNIFFVKLKTVFKLENLKERGQLEDLGVDGMIIVE
jgi:hypothetical protein